MDKLSHGETRAAMGAGGRGRLQSSEICPPPNERTVRTFALDSRRANFRNLDEKKFMVPFLAPTVQVEVAHCYSSYTLVSNWQNLSPFLLSLNGFPRLTSSFSAFLSAKSLICYQRSEASAAHKPRLLSNSDRGHAPQSELSRKHRHGLL